MQEVRRFLFRRKMLFVLFAMFVSMSIASPYFLRLNNLSAIFSQIAIYGVAIVGMAFAIICGEMDLSIGPIMALSGIILVQMEMRIGFIPAFAIALLICSCIGMLNGWLVTSIRISAFVTTLAMMIMINGVALLVQPGPVPIRIDAFLRFGSGRIGVFPYTFIVFVGLIIFAQIVLRRTRFGRNIYAVGGSAESASRAGVNVKFYKYSVFLLTSLSAAAAGIMLVGRLGSSSAVYASSAALSSISSLVIGGISLVGGRGDAIDALVGIFIMGIVTNALAIFGISPFNQLWIEGLILISVVSIDAIMRSKRKA